MEKRSTKWDLTAYPNYEVENLPGYALHLIEEAQAAGKPGNRSRDTIKQVILNKSDIIRLIQKLSNLIIGYHKDNIGRKLMGKHPVFTTS